jgi:competence ComEA-like helix-hairpin-helix protein
MRRMFKKTAIALALFMLAFCGSAFAAPGVNVYEHQLGKGQVNVNTATKDQLVWFIGQSNVGVSASTPAENILAYRDANGPFNTMSDLKNVKGINDTVLYWLHFRVKTRGLTNYDPEETVPAPGNNFPFRPDQGKVHNG